jgi:hypothetical protein
MAKPGYEGINKSGGGLNAYGILFTPVLDVMEHLYGRWAFKWRRNLQDQKLW